MENLKEEEFVDLKAIERKAGGGVKTPHMRMILEALAQVKCQRKTSILTFLIFPTGHIDGKHGRGGKLCQLHLHQHQQHQHQDQHCKDEAHQTKFQLFQFHGAWMVWFRGTAGMGDKSREEVN